VTRKGALTPGRGGGHAGTGPGGGAHAIRGGSHGTGGAHAGRGEAEVQVVGEGGGAVVVFWGGHLDRGWGECWLCTPVDRMCHDETQAPD
jgi:hypothetical protein